jgi:hypothetical protein
MPGNPYNNINPNEGFVSKKEGFVSRNEVFCNINKKYKCPLNNSCRVEWNERLQIFSCQCHGCKFSLTGKIISGPSQSDLSC